MCSPARVWSCPPLLSRALSAAPVEDDFGFTPVTAPVEDFDPFGFEPVGVALDDLDADVAPCPWTVRFGPSRAALANGSEPLLSIREVERLGGKITSVDVSALPTLRDLDPEDSYFVWTMSVPSDVAEIDIADCFDFVAPDSLIEITRSEVPDEPVVSEAPKGRTGGTRLPSRRPSLRLSSHQASRLRLRCPQRRATPILSSRRSAST